MMSPMKLTRRISPARLTPRSSGPRFLVVVLGLLAILHLYLFLQGRAIFGRKWNWDSENDSRDDCGAFSGLDRVVITVDTGATEALKKIPTQLRTSLRCAPNVYIFSDMEQKIGDRQIYDALDTVPANVTDGNTDFEIYRRQKILQENPEKISSIFHDFKVPGRPDDSAAWTLDKYKKLHIIEKAWELHPDADWYLHIEADTYLILPSLMAWVQRLDPSKELYLGSLSLINNVPFAHGGSGTLLSNAATRNLVVTHTGTAERWDYQMHNECCGDYVVAVALQEVGIGLLNAWPVINGETSDTIPFASHHWCQPLMTMHHISPAEAERLGAFEQRRENKTIPVLYSEVFKNLIINRIPDSIDDWDNGGKDETVSDIDSVESCIEACANNPECFQSLFDGEECTLGTKNFRFGEKREPEDGKTWQSSWNITRIEAWVSKQEPCAEITFPFEEVPMDVVTNKL